MLVVIAAAYIGLRRNHVWLLPAAHFAVATVCVMGAGGSWGITLLVPGILDLPIITPAYLLAISSAGLTPQGNVVLAFMAFSVLGTLQWYSIGRFIQRRGNRKRAFPVIALILLATILAAFAYIQWDKARSERNSKDIDEMLQQIL